MSQLAESLRDATAESAFDLKFRALADETVPAYRCRT